ncbi:MAG TPA: GNAT family protein [Bacteroidales bacterium]|nr:GNAT family protein [Bacteroidales bacterium]
MNNKIFILRPWRQSDIESLVKYANNPDIAKNLTNAFPHPYTQQSGEAYLETVCSQKPVRVFAIEADGEAVGSIGVFPQTDIHCQNAEMGYWLAEPFWGKGIMTSAIKQMVDYAFRTFDINRVYARPFGSNKASQRVLEKSGFKLEARFKDVLLKNGRTEDELIYAIRKE